MKKERTFMENDKTLFSYRDNIKYAFENVQELEIDVSKKKESKIFIRSDIHRK